METNLITRIEKSSSYSKRYRIYVNGEFLCSVHEDVLVKHHLYKGMAVNQEQIQELLAAEEYNRVRLAVLRYLSYRPRTVWEVKQYIAGKEFSEEHGEKVIIEMQHLGYLDDRKYAKAWVEERRNTRGYGPIRLRQELMKKRIVAKWIDEALGHTEEEEERHLAMKVAERRYLRICRDPWPKVERKLGQYLLRQGFSADIVYSVLDVFRSRHVEEERNF
ncbi:RecX family transcriptional regulator [Paenactinomyces guangxiensis]|uniref:Regulatory protein RecX n=1 Tax=Paenactinomyces guangxiensis TaxID=1490290 RepID=A0A7W1WQX5_9BACL|nr:RecX family transcriptional regulator [Paenactinomyces guangxiensis]MBA4494415.1 RecX family transcriptional regulator [Paenactinomyces guangxiensis]MBH8591530.1 RecX family transcriptional regulator [Paenactinomyces guangxiensis]